MKKFLIKIPALSKLNSASSLIKMPRREKSRLRTINNTRLKVKFRYVN